MPVICCNTGQKNLRKKRVVPGPQTEARRRYHLFARYTAPINDKSRTDGKLAQKLALCPRF
jgi:hypothetical protein